MAPSTVLNAGADLNSRVSFNDLCQSTGVHENLMLEMIDFDIARPVAGAHPEEWQFNVAAIDDVQKAARIHRDLAVDWAGIAFAMSLLDEIAALRAENKELRAANNKFDGSPKGTTIN